MTIVESGSYICKYYLIIVSIGLQTIKQVFVVSNTHAHVFMTEGLSIKGRFFGKTRLIRGLRLSGPLYTVLFKLTVIVVLFPLIFT